MELHRSKNFIGRSPLGKLVTEADILFRWKHACACHKGSMLEGEGDFWYDDEVAQAIREHESHAGLLTTSIPQPMQSIPPAPSESSPNTKLASAETDSGLR